MANTYDIKDLFRTAFGLKNLARYQVSDEKETAPDLVFDVTNDSPTAPDLTFSNLETIDVDEADKLSASGTPVLYNFVIKRGTYKTINRDGTVGEKTISDFEFPYATIVEFRRAKRIVKTAVNGANGFVKEMFGFDDWRITIRGLCVNGTSSTDVKATEQYDRLVELEKIADGLEVVGELFQKKDIYNIVFEEVNFGRLAGKPNVIPFEIRAVSDTPFELILA